MTQNQKPDYGLMLLDGIEEIRQHLTEWGREEGSLPQRNIAAGWVVGMLGEQIAKLKADPDKLDLMNIVAPAMLRALAAEREREERGD